MWDGHVTGHVQIKKKMFSLPFCNTTCKRIWKTTPWEHQNLLAIIKRISAMDANLFHFSIISKGHGNPANIVALVFPDCLDFQTGSLLCKAAVVLLQRCTGGSQTAHTEGWANVSFGFLCFFGVTSLRHMIDSLRMTLTAAVAATVRGTAEAQGASLNMNRKGLSSQFLICKSSFEVQRCNRRKAYSMCAAVVPITVAALWIY